VTTTPATFRLAWAGVFGVPLLVIGAVAVRGPVFPDDGDPSLNASASASADAAPDRPAGGSSAHPSHSAVPLLSALRPVISTIPIPTAANLSVGSPAQIRTAADDLERNLRGNNLTSAIESLKALIAIDPDVIKDAHDDIIDLTQRVMLLKGNEPSDMFDILVNKMGSGGIDILYEMVTTKGGSDAAVESKKLLDKPDVLAKGTPAVQVAYKLRDNVRGNGSCEAIKSLFPDVRQYGDRRAFGELLLLGGRCGRRHVGCCLSGDAEYEDTMKAMLAKGYQ